VHESTQLSAQHEQLDNPFTASDSFTSHIRSIKRARQYGSLANKRTSLRLETGNTKWDFRHIHSNPYGGASRRCLPLRCYMTNVTPSPGIGLSKRSI
uniref:Uncharacterized protein n=1 Tax=Mesocestoides corti TaxID=53468 RepID=A0A5K3G1C2_MESCO